MPSSEPSSMQCAMPSSIPSSEPSSILSAMPSSIPSSEPSLMSSAVPNNHKSYIIVETKCSSIYKSYHDIIRRAQLHAVCHAKCGIISCAKRELLSVIRAELKS
eukprot:13080013-Ditylum_brightwellii.AAC.1